MATARRQPGEVETVDPSVDTGPTEGLSTMAQMFSPAQTVDEVYETHPHDLGDAVWIVRPINEVEDMTVGSPNNHFNLKAGIRYRVPQRVAEILYNRDLLMEVPYLDDGRRR
jgi:hypothetical protein